MTEPRSRQTRALAEQALVRLLHELRDDDTSVGIAVILAALLGP